MYNRSLQLKESEKDNILEMYYGSSHVFDNYLTIDGRFFIKNDQVYDLHELKELGSIFSIDNIQTIFESVKIENNTLTEDIKNIFTDKKNQSFILLEAKHKLLNRKKLLSEQSEDLSTDGSTSGSKLVEWFLMVARKLKKALYSVGGLVVDAILVGSGIGKTFQWIPWAICLALDTYQWTSGNYGSDTEFKESSTFWKILNIGFHILGMMTTGFFAKSARKLFGPIKFLKKESQIAVWVAKNPAAQKVLVKINGLLSGTGSWLNKASKFISNKMPKLGGWFSGLIGGISKVTNTIGTFIGKILKAPKAIGTSIQNTKKGTKLLGKVGAEGSKDLGKGLQAGAVTAGVIGGVSAVPLLLSKVKGGGVNDIERQTMKMVGSDLESRLNKAF